jgi:hypothetical protein
LPPPGATAALSGLIFVALSVNIRAVLSADEKEGQNFLTGRALEALVVLLLILAICVVALTPTIARDVLAAFILGTAACSAISPIRALRAAHAIDSIGKGPAVRVLMAGTLTFTLLAGGVTLAARHGGGLDWLPAAFVIGIAIAAVNAWVLLVEILR